MIKMGHEMRWSDICDVDDVTFGDIDEDWE